MTIEQLLEYLNPRWGHASLASICPRQTAPPEIFQLFQTLVKFNEEVHSLSIEFEKKTARSINSWKDYREICIGSFQQNTQDGLKKLCYTVSFTAMKSLGTLVNITLLLCATNKQRTWHMVEDNGIQALVGAIFSVRSVFQTFLFIGHPTLATLDIACEKTLSFASKTLQQCGQWGGIISRKIIAKCSLGMLVSSNNRVRSRT